MTRQDIEEKMKAVEKSLTELMEKRKELRAYLLGYQTILEMVDNGQIDLFHVEHTDAKASGAKK